MIKVSYAQKWPLPISTSLIYCDKVACPEDEYVSISLSTIWVDGQALFVTLPDCSLALDVVVK